MIERHELHPQGHDLGLVLLGLLLTPIVIGIPIVLYGLHPGGRKERWLICTQCGLRIPQIRRRSLPAGLLLIAMGLGCGLILIRILRGIP